MYSYYALSALGPGIQRYLWWKKYLTQIQLVQFAIIGVYGMSLYMFNTGYPFYFSFLPISNSIIYLILFGDFYYKSYNKSRQDKSEQIPVENNNNNSKQD